MGVTSRYMIVLAQRPACCFIFTDDPYESWLIDTFCFSLYRSLCNGELPTGKG
jgi:hypothetical protein